MCAQLDTTNPALKDVLKKAAGYATFSQVGVSGTVILPSRSR